MRLIATKQKGYFLLLTKFSKSNNNKTFRLLANSKAEKNLGAPLALKEFIQKQGLGCNNHLKYKQINEHKSINTHNLRKCSNDHFTNKLKQRFRKKDEDIKASRECIR